MTMIAHIAYAHIKTAVHHPGDTLCKRNITMPQV